MSDDAVWDWNSGQWIGAKPGRANRSTKRREIWVRRVRVAAVKSLQQCNPRSLDNGTTGSESDT